MEMGVTPKEVSKMFAPSKDERIVISVWGEAKHKFICRKLARGCNQCQEDERIWKVLQVNTLSQKAVIKCIKCDKEDEVSFDGFE